MYPSSTDILEVLPSICAYVRHDVIMNGGRCGLAEYIVTSPCGNDVTPQFSFHASAFIGHIQQIEYSVYQIFCQEGGGVSCKKERRKRIGFFLERDITCSTVSRVRIREG